MGNVKIIMSDGNSVTINDCDDLSWNCTKNAVIVKKSNGRNIIFNLDFVKVAGFVEDLEGLVDI